MIHYFPCKLIHTYETKANQIKSTTTNIIDGIQQTNKRRKKTNTLRTHNKNNEVCFILLIELPKFGLTQLERY